MAVFSVQGPHALVILGRHALPHRHTVSLSLRIKEIDRPPACDRPSASASHDPETSRLPPPAANEASFEDKSSLDAGSLHTLQLLQKIAAFGLPALMVPLADPGKEELLIKAHTGWLGEMQRAKD